jgi:hypothetical protein
MAGAGSQHEPETAQVADRLVQGAEIRATGMPSAAGALRVASDLTSTLTW